MRRVGVLTGLESEARLLRNISAATPPPLIGCAGADPDRARREAARLIEGGAGALMSFGIAGGLNPRLRPGNLILADRVVLPGGRRIPTDESWREQLLARAAEGGLSAEAGTIAGSERVLRTVAQKSALAERTGASAVDMESHVVAERAEAADLPFLVVRAISDPAGQTLPRSALGSVDAKGRRRPLRVLARVSLAPWEIPALMELRRNARAALEGLGGLTGLLGPEIFRAV